jgi:hypothetical protein
MSIDAMKQALEAMEEIHRTGDTQLFDLCYAPKVIPALRLAIEQAERQAPVLINIELSRRMAAVKVSNFYGSIIRDAEKEIERLHGLVLGAVAAEREACAKVCDDLVLHQYSASGCASAIRARGETK